MTPTDSLDPLADYLEPRFGNVYDKYYGFIGKEWPADLRQAVRHYLIHEADDDLYRQALALLTGRSYEDVQANDRAEEADAMLAQEDPWNVIYTFHEAAVILRPTLESLITSLDSWADDNDLEAAIWLETHATHVELRDMIPLIPHYQPPDWHLGHSGLLADDVVEALPPAKLLEAWTKVRGPAPSDLTDAEWQLLVPLLPRNQWTWSDDDVLEAMNRPSINGFLYRHAKGMGWSRLPRRYYGNNHNVLRNKYYRWHRDGVFARLREALEDNPDAARLVAWLKTIDD